MWSCVYAFYVIVNSRPVILAGALGLKKVGTVSELAMLIKQHLTTNPDIQFNPRFSGLFLQNKWHHVGNSGSITVESNV